MKKFFVLIFSALLSFSLYAETIISPVEGVFANRQMLVLNLAEDEEAYYSFSNSSSDIDPMNSGFAYDGPVLLDVTGHVILKIAVSKASAEPEDEVHRLTIEYDVPEEKLPESLNNEAYEFIRKVLSDKMLICSGIETVDIPSSLKFSLGNGALPLSAGKSLHLSGENNLYRYVPCTVTDGAYSWRFLISLSERNITAVPEAVEVPFRISDWYTFEFTGKNLIWCIDDGMWSASREPVYLDRRIQHVIQWQSVAYEHGNPVEKFILEPKPQIEKKYSDKSLEFSLDVNSPYRMKILSNGLSDEIRTGRLYQNIVFDVFEGECVSARVEFGLYCNGVYQGKILSDYSVDRKPPVPPVFESDNLVFFSRSDVSLKINGEDESLLYYSMAGPFELPVGTYTENSQLLDSYRSDDFVLYDGSNLHLKGDKGKAVFYRISSYAVDMAGNKSEVSEYPLIIDEYNYFIDFSSLSESPDGSRSKPFNTVYQVLNAINSSDFTHFFITGDFVIPDGVWEIGSNCAFTGNAQSRIVVEADGKIAVNGSSIVFSNCFLLKKSFPGQKETGLLIELNDSAVSFNDSLIICDYVSGGAALSLEKSTASFVDSSMLVKGNTYACCVTGIGAQLESAGSHFTSIADSAVNFSLDSCSLHLKNNNCRISSRIGHIIESKESNLKLFENSFKASFESRSLDCTPVYKDRKTLVIEDYGNKEEGF